MLEPFGSHIKNQQGQGIYISIRNITVKYSDIKERTPRKGFTFVYLLISTESQNQNYQMCFYSDLVWMPFY